MTDIIANIYILVTGSRNWTDEDFIYQKLDQALIDMEATNSHYICLIAGGAEGADRIARNWAYDRNFSIDYREFPAEWDTYGRSAGPKRNQKMVDWAAIALTEPHSRITVRAFQIGNSPGTADCLRRAKAAGLHGIRYSI